MTIQDLATRFPTLRFAEPSSGVLEIVLDAPGLNAVTAEMHEDLAHVWAAVDETDWVRAVVVSGAGGAFSSGGSFDLLERAQTDVQFRTRTMLLGRRTLFGMLEARQPIVSAISGPAVGAGLVVALMADISVASRTARLIDSHTRIGVAAGDHAALAWPLLCGMAKAKYHLLTGRGLTGEEAERIGLVSLCVEDDEVRDTALDVAATLADGAELAISLTKRALNGWYRSMAGVFDTSLAYEFYGMGTAEAVEGRAAIVERRPPRFHD